MCNASFFQSTEFPYYSFLSGTSDIFDFNSSFGKSPRVTDSGTGFWNGNSVGKTGEWIPVGQSGKQESTLLLIHVTYEEKKISR